MEFKKVLTAFGVVTIVTTGVLAGPSAMALELPPEISATAPTVEDASTAPAGDDASIAPVNEAPATPGASVPATDGASVAAEVPAVEVVSASHYVDADGKRMFAYQVKGEPGATVQSGRQHGPWGTMGDLDSNGAATLYSDRGPAEGDPYVLRQVAGGTGSTWTTLAWADYTTGLPALELVSASRYVDDAGAQRFTYGVKGSPGAAVQRMAPGGGWVNMGSIGADGAATFISSGGATMTDPAYLRQLTHGQGSVRTPVYWADYAAAIELVSASKYVDDLGTQRFVYQVKGVPGAKAQRKVPGGSWVDMGPIGANGSGTYYSTGGATETDPVLLRQLDPGASSATVAVHWADFTTKVPAVDVVSAAQYLDADGKWMFAYEVKGSPGATVQGGTPSGAWGAIGVIGSKGTATLHSDRGPGEGKPYVLRQVVAGTGGAWTTLAWADYTNVLTAIELVSASKYVDHLGTQRFVYQVKGVPGAKVQRMVPGGSWVDMGPIGADGTRTYNSPGGATETDPVLLRQLDPGASSATVAVHWADFKSELPAPVVEQVSKFTDKDGKNKVFFAVSGGVPGAVLQQEGSTVNIGNFNAEGRAVITTERAVGATYSLRQGLNAQYSTYVKGDVKSALPAPVVEQVSQFTDKDGKNKVFYVVSGGVPGAVLQQEGSTVNIGNFNAEGRLSVTTERGKSDAYSLRQGLNAQYSTYVKGQVENVAPIVNVKLSAPTAGAVVTEARPVFTGTGTDGATIEVTSGETVIATSTVAGGTWSATPGADVPLGANSGVVNQKIKGAQQSSVPFSFTREADSLKVSNPVQGGTIAADASGYVVPVFSGTATPGATVRVQGPWGDVFATATADASGAWSATWDFAVAPNSYVGGATVELVDGVEIDREGYDFTVTKFAGQ